MKQLLNYTLLALVCLFAYCCTKKPETLSLEQVKYNSNKSSYPTTKMDSSQAVTSITKQKAREVLELSILFHNGNKDSEIDHALYQQISGYFYKPDSTTLKNLLAELDSLKVRNAKINKFEVRQEIAAQDTLNFADFEVEYFDDKNRSIGSYQRQAQYLLVPAEVQFKKEFKFYFLNFYPTKLKDSISSGSTR